MSERQKEVAVDRISDLDDNSLICILSLLKTDEAVRTSVLSKRWLYLWTFLPCLNFNYKYNKNDDDDAGFRSFVNYVMKLHNVPKVKKFTMYCHKAKDPDSDFHSQFDIWIRFATMKEVEVLDVSTKVYVSEDNIYTVPLDLYACSSLTMMKWGYGEFNWSGQINWKYLKVLAFTHCRFGQDFLVKLFSQALPKLESLSFYQCYGLHNISVTSRALKRLVIINYGPLGEAVRPVMKIEAPFLHSLSIEGIMERPIQLGNLSSLTTACFEFEMGSYFFNETDGEDTIMFRKMLEKVSHVSNLSLHTRVPELNGMEIFLPSLSCKRLVIKVKLYFGDFPRIAALLHRSCELEELTLELEEQDTDILETLELEEQDLEQDDEASEKTYWTSCNMTFTCLALHLKTIKIVHHSVPFIIEEPALILLQFLLGKACVLEKIVIEKKWSGSRVLDDDELSLEYDSTKKLLSLPRASSHVAIKLP